MTLKNIDIERDDFMFMIDIDNIDKLGELTYKLSMLTFLQGLIVSDDYIEYGDGFETVFTYAASFCIRWVSSRALRRIPWKNSSGR